MPETLRNKIQWVFHEVLFQILRVSKKHVHLICLLCFDWLTWANQGHYITCQEYHLDITYLSPPHSTS